MIKNLRYILILTLILHACSNTKYLPAGQKLYTGGEVKVIDTNATVTKGDKKAIEGELKELLRPKPNGSILGLRVKLWIYNKTRTTKPKGLKHWLNTKFGEPPVLVSSVDLVKNSDILTNRLQNISYFQAQVSGDTVGKNKTAKAVYSVQTGPAYIIKNLTFPTETGNLDTAVAGTAKKSLLKVNDKYNLDVIKNERLRIDARLKEEGFYYFSPEDLIIRVDSTVGNHKVDLYMKVKNTTADKARRIYTINNIYVYPSYSLRDTSLKLDSAVKYRWYNVIDPRKTIRPFAFKNTVLLQPGEVYNRTEHNNSLNRFVNLGPFKYVKNRFEDVSADSSKLDVYYFLTKYPKKSLQLDVLGRTTSANYVGTQVNINWRNRNAFKGGETLTIGVFGSTDVQFSGQSSGYNVYQAGVTGTLSWPRFISPVEFRQDNAFIPRTNLTLGYTLINRTNLYTLSSFNGSFGYSWKSDPKRQHELNLININLVRPQNVTQEYRDSIANTGSPALSHVIDKQLTFGPSYSYTYTNTMDEWKTNTFYWNSKVSWSAAVYGLITGADTLAGKVRTVFGTPFNQFFKLENEFRFYHKTSPGSSIAARFIASVGVPYGNSTQLPYTQQFFIGGTNSLRGFRARSLGPGTYYYPDSLRSKNGFLPDQSGDIKLEANLEWRPKLFSIVRGAVFMDAGNIWNVKSQAGLPGAAFGKTFFKELAVDAGVGLRFDLTVLVLRTDLGFPLRKPWLPDGQRWVINQVDFGSGKWRSDNLVFNLAIGYPF
jgi:outer membrane protein insertion porin family